MQLIVRAAILAVAMAPSPLFAVLLGVPNEAIESPNGKFVLVLLVPESYYRKMGFELRDFDPQRDGTHIWSADDFRRRREAYLRQVALRESYPASGLYRRNDPSTPLWTTAWRSSVKDIFVSNDGVHHVFAFQEWDSTISNRGDAVELYANGKLLASYREFELLPSWRLRFLAARYLKTEWPTCTSARLNDATGRFVIHTNHGDVFEFDIATGQLVRGTSPWSGIVPLLITLGAACGAGILFVIFRWIRRQTRALVNTPAMPPL
jgi:hypothetical protein